MGRHSLPTRTARKMAEARKTFGAGYNGGRPRSGKRCPCGADSLARSRTRARNEDGTCPPGDGHDPSCPFFRERAIIV
jgi:hypothetical protein